jgi:hypothetical protein
VKSQPSKVSAQSKLIASPILEEEENEEEKDSNIEHNEECECCKKNAKLFKQIMRKLNSRRNSKRAGGGLNRLSRL